MAEAGNIKAFTVNFSAGKNQLNEKVFVKLFQALHQDHVDVSIFDFSNVWFEKYLGTKPTLELIDLMKEYGVVSPNSLFLVTHWKNLQYYSDGERAKRPLFHVLSQDIEHNSHDEYDWRYHAFSFKKIEAAYPDLIHFPNYDTLDGAKSARARKRSSPSSIASNLFYNADLSV